MPDWRIYYSDITFDSDEGSPEEAPGLDVQVIVRKDEARGRMILFKNDFYYFRYDLGLWWGSDLFGLLDQLTHDPEGNVGAVKAGRHATNFDEVLREARHDPDFKLVMPDE